MSSSSRVLRLIHPASPGPDRARTGGAPAERLDLAGASPDKRDVVGGMVGGRVGGERGPGRTRTRGEGLEGGGEGGGAAAAAKATAAAEAAKNLLLQDLHQIANSKQGAPRACSPVAAQNTY